MLLEPPKALPRWLVTGARVLCLALTFWAFGQPGVHAQSYPTPQGGEISAGYPEPQISPIRAASATRLRALQADLTLLAERDRGRIFDGILRIGIGTAFGVLGGFAPDARVLLVSLGAVSVVQGITSLTVQPNVPREIQTFAAAPARSQSDVEEKIRLGEAALTRIATRARSARLTSAILMMVASASYVPAYWSSQRIQHPSYRFGHDPLDYVLLTLSGVGFGAGVAQAVVPGDAERRLEDYKQLKAETASARVPSLHLALTPRGAVAAATLRF